MYLAASCLAATAILTVAEAAEVAEVAGGAWAFPVLPTPEEPEGLCTFRTVAFEFEIEKK